MGILILLFVLAALSAGGLIGMILDVRSDGYGPRPDRADSTVPERRRF